VFFGGAYGNGVIAGPYVYNLKEQRMVENQNRGNKSLRFDGKFRHSACYYEPENKIIFYGGLPSQGGYENANSNPALFFREDEGNLISFS